MLSIPRHQNTCYCSSLAESQSHFVIPSSPVKNPWSQWRQRGLTRFSKETAALSSGMIVIVLRGQQVVIVSATKHAHEIQTGDAIGHVVLLKSNIIILVESCILCSCHLLIPAIETNCCQHNEFYYKHNLPNPSLKWDEHSDSGEHRADPTCPSICVTLSLSPARSTFLAWE